MVVLAVAVAVAAALWMRTQRDLGGHAGVGILLIASGGFAVAGAIADWHWFMTSRRARRFVGLFTRTGARFFYAVLGGALAGSGVVLTLA